MARVNDLLAAILPPLAGLLGLLLLPMLRQGRERWGRRILWTGCLLYLIPHVICLLWCFPCLDDWSYGAAGRAGWWTAQTATYAGWSGRVASTAILTSWGLGSDANIACGIIYVLMLAGIWLWLVLAVHAAVSVAVTSAADRWLATVALMTAWVAGMPASVEGLYWLPGAATYQGGAACALTAYACLARGRTLAALAPCMLAPLFCEVVALLIVPMVCWMAWRHRRAWAAALLAVAGLLVAALCPGNAQRMDVASVQGGSSLATLPQALPGQSGPCCR